MHPNAKTLTRFYKAFAQLDHNTMASCYADNATFHDPVFHLKGREQISSMWNMLCATTNAKGKAHWKLDFKGIQADAAKGSAHWEARYVFSSTGKIVHNIIDGKFTFTPDGFIATHHDHFDFWRWSRQALGAPGLLLGWTPLLKMMVQKKARVGLQKFMANRSA